MMVDHGGGDGVDMYRKGKEGGENDFLGGRKGEDMYSCGSGGRTRGGRKGEDMYSCGSGGRT
nr:hypothetical protein [Tanacetum cinerariifolium]